MSDNLKYRVLPQEAILQPVLVIDNPSLTDSERESVEGLSRNALFLIWGGVFISVGGFIGLYLAMRISTVPLILIASISGIAGASLFVVLIAMISKRINISAAEQKKAEEVKQRLVYAQNIETANTQEMHRVWREAESLSSNLMRMYESSMNLATDLAQHINRATRLLQQAETEYKDNAFAPFWDAVENAAKELAAFNDKTNLLSKNAADYYSMLSSRKHTFPTFPANMRAIQDVSPVVNELRRIVRLGQTNFQFANIWEHRKTRGVLIAGFRTLSEAINNLEGTIEYSISNLQQSVSSDIAKLVEEEIKTRESLDNRMLEQNRMLDNIQHHRQPGITDSPSKF